MRSYYSIWLSTFGMKPSMPSGHEMQEVSFRNLSYSLINPLKPIVHAHISLNCPQEFNYFTRMAMHADYSLVVKDRARQRLNSRQNWREELPSFILIPDSSVIKRKKAISGSRLLGPGDVDDYHRHLPSDPADRGYKGLSGHPHRSTAVLYLVSSWLQNR